MQQRVLLLGVGPLPFYQSNQLFGFGIRTWQFALPILAEGSQVTLVTCEFGVQKESELKDIRYGQDLSSFGDLEHISLPEPNPRNMNILLTRLEEIIRTHQPNAIITAGSTISTNLAASLKTDLPIWMDMFGDLFAEIQAKTAFLDESSQFDFFHQVMTRVLLRGDRFSVVSDAQKGAAVGQLGFIGRLNRFTLGEEMVHTIPCAVDGNISPVQKNTVLRGKTCSESDFLLLCSGGFNTWSDVDTLFYGIEGAMEKNKRIQCIVTGGKIQGHHEDGYKRFQNLVGKSPYESRFHLLGWVSNEDVAAITQECDLGLNIDLPIYESMLGSRNRILFWMQCALPTLTTVTTELSQIIQQQNLGYCIEVGDDKAMSKCIVEAASNRAKLKKLGVKSRRFVYSYFTFEESVKPLLQWIKNPTKAGDNAERLLQNNQALSHVDHLLHDWAFSHAGNEKRVQLPKPMTPITKIRPYGKHWWDRLLGK